jgi:hypothetical protein
LAATTDVATCLVLLDIVDEDEFGEAYAPFHAAIPFEQLAARGNFLESIRQLHMRNRSIAEPLVFAVSAGDMVRAGELIASGGVIEMPANGGVKGSILDLAEVAAIYECRCAPESHTDESREYMFVTRSRRWMKYTARRVPYVSPEKLGSDWSGWELRWSADSNR